MKPAASILMCKTLIAGFTCWKGPSMYRFWRCLIARNTPQVRVFSRLELRMRAYKFLVQRCSWKKWMNMCPARSHSKKKKKVALVKASCLELLLGCISSSQFIHVLFFCLQIQQVPKHNYWVKNHRFRSAELHKVRTEAELIVTALQLIRHIPGRDFPFRQTCRSG